jgi:hypothetical protein
MIDQPTLKIDARGNLVFTFACVTPGFRDGDPDLAVTTEVTISRGELYRMAHRAVKNKTARSVDGPAIVKLTDSRPIPPITS